MKSEKDPERSYLQSIARDLYLFSALPQRFGLVNKETPLIDKWTWFYHARRFLWANRLNFHLDKDEWHLLLKGPDLYDAEHPPELPPELVDPPKPEAAPVMGPEPEKETPVKP